MMITCMSGLDYVEKLKRTCTLRCTNFIMMLYDSRLLFRFASSYTVCFIAIDEFVVNSIRYDIGSCCESSCCEAVRFKNDFKNFAVRVIGTHT